MKKFTLTLSTLILVFFTMLFCGKKPEASKAMESKTEDLLKFIPGETKGVIFLDMHRIMTTEMANKLIKEDKNYKKYEEFIQKTGIDPQKDVYFVAVSLGGELGEKKNMEGAGVVNLKYKKETLLSLIREKAEEEGQAVLEEDYNGITVYGIKEEEDEDEGHFSFLDDSHLVVGNRNGVKSVLDVIQKKRQNVFKNQALSDLIQKTNKNAMLWGAILFPPAAREEAASKNPMLQNLKDISATSFFFDYKNKAIDLEINLMSSDETKNKQIADLLNGFKAMGGMAAAEKPEVGELMNKIQIQALKDQIKVTASIPEALIDKLKEKKPEKEEEQK